MATSQHLAVRNAVAALFAGLAGDRIFSNRDLPLPTDAASRIDVYRVSSDPEQPTTWHPIDWKTLLRIEIRARSASGVSAEQVAEDLACACFERVMAAQDLGGLAQDLQPGGLEWDQDEADTAVARVTWEITVTHVTDNNVIT